MHLADQVRACGPGFTWTEFWVERMVQLVKRMVKYRSTAYPELLFVHDWLLTLACRRVKLTPDGWNCMSLYEALQAKKMRKRGEHDVAGVQEALLLGAPKECDIDEVRQVLYTPTLGEGGEELQGLPQLLIDDCDLLQDGWPVFIDEDKHNRGGLILHELGLEGPLGNGREGASVSLQKFTRADLPIGDTVSSVQCKSQTRKNNQWFIVYYAEEDNEGHIEMRVYVGQFQYFVRAEFKGNVLPEGATCPGQRRRFPAVLKLGIAKLYTCEDMHGPGVRPADPGINRLHELVRTDRLDACHPRTQFVGEFVLDLRSVNSQVVPTRERNGARYFCIANKLSGRFAGVRR